MAGAVAEVAEVAAVAGAVASVAVASAALAAGGSSPCRSLLGTDSVLDATPCATGVCSPCRFLLYTVSELGATPYVQSSRDWMLMPSAGPRLVVAEVAAAEVVALGGATRVRGSPCQSLMQEVTGFEQCLPAVGVQISFVVLRWPSICDVNVADLSRHCENLVNICLPWDSQGSIWINWKIINSQRRSLPLKRSPCSLTGPG